MIDNPGKYIKVEIKEFIRNEIAHLEEKISIREKTMDRRLDTMNEIRHQLDEQADTFVTKDELKLVEKDIKMLSRLVYIGLGVFLLLQLILATIFGLLMK